MKNILNNKKLLTCLSVIMIGIIIAVYADMSVLAKIELPTKIVSYPSSYTNIIPSYTENEIKIPNTGFYLKNDEIYKRSKDQLIEIDFNDGLLDRNKKEFYYTVKSQTSWGSEKYIYIYSLLKKTVVRKIEFDNSGYEKYPIAISPNSKILALAESAQSVGEVNITLVDLVSGKEIQKLTKLYAPTLVFDNETSIIYLEPTLNCKNRACVQDGIQLKLENLKTKVIKSKKIADKNSDGSLPSFDNLEIVNGYAVINSRFDKTNNSF